MQLPYGTIDIAVVRALARAAAVGVMQTGFRARLGLCARARRVGLHKNPATADTSVVGRRPHRNAAAEHAGTQANHLRGDVSSLSGSARVLIKQALSFNSHGYSTSWPPRPCLDHLDSNQRNSHCYM